METIIIKIIAVLIIYTFIWQFVRKALDAGDAVPNLIYANLLALLAAIIEVI